MDRVIKKSKWQKYRISILLSAVVLTPLGYTLFGRDNSSKLYLVKEKLGISEIRQGDFAEYISADGTVLPLETVYLDAVEGGVVDKIFLDEGGMLKPGDTILTLINGDLQLDYVNRETQILDLLNQIETARLNSQQTQIRELNDLADLKYKLKDARRKYNTNKLLASTESVSRNELLQSEDEHNYLNEKMMIAGRALHQDSQLISAQIRQMNSSAKRMQTNLHMVKKNLDNLVVRAVMGGQLTSFDLKKGQLIQKGQTIGQIDAEGGFKLRVQIDEHYIARVFSGQLGSVEFNGRTYNMRVQRVIPQVRNGFFAADMVFDGQEPEGIRKGQNLSVRLALSAQVKSLLLEKGAFAQTTGGNWIFVLSADGKTAERRNIRLGRQNPRYFELTDGLADGEKVITSSYTGFEDKDKLLLEGE